MNAAEITDKLGLHSLRHRNWYIQATCATSGDGLYEGLDWLANQLKNKKWVESVDGWAAAHQGAPVGFFLLCLQDESGENRPAQSPAA